MKHVLKWPMMLLLIVGASAFELFNYTTNEYGIRHLIGDMGSIASVAALAFCLVDIGGVIRIFTPETSVSNEPKEVLWLLVSWVIASSMNAILTWYSFMVAISEMAPATRMLTTEEIVKVFPVLFAVMTLFARLGLIGSLATGIDSIKAPSMKMPKIAMKAPSMPSRPTKRSEPVYRPASPSPLTTIRGGNGSYNFGEDER